MTFLPKPLTRPRCPRCGGIPRSKGAGHMAGQRRWYCDACRHGWQVPPAGPRQVSRVRSVPPPAFRPKRDAKSWKEQKDAEMRAKGGVGAKRGATACVGGSTGHFWELEERPRDGKYHGVCKRCGQEAVSPAHPAAPWEPEQAVYVT